MPTKSTLSRRALLGAGSAFWLARTLCHFSFAEPLAEVSKPLILTPPAERAPTLLSAPIELAGNWGQMIPGAASKVIARMRYACLDGVRLVSDRQPTRLRVDRHTSGPPAIWLHPDGSTIGWIIVDTGERAWIQLAYQFGHELGHVMANSWQPHAAPKPPSQWLEEALVEAFSLRGLVLLAASWKQNSPFPNDNRYGDAISKYRDNIVQGYQKLAEQQGLTRDPAGWFADHRADIELPGLNPFARAACLTILNEYELVSDCIEALGALNRWPGRTGLPLDEYLRQWTASCAELQASTHLPTRLREIFYVVPPL